MTSDSKVTAKSLIDWLVSEEIITPEQGIKISPALSLTLDNYGARVIAECGELDVRVVEIERLLAIA